MPECEEPMDVEHGNILTPMGRTINAKAYINCDFGYELPDGQLNYITCTLEEEDVYPSWSEIPSCKGRAHHRLSCIRQYTPLENESIYCWTWKVGFTLNKEIPSAFYFSKYELLTGHENFKTLFILHTCKSKLLQGWHSDDRTRIRIEIIHRCRRTG